MKTSPNEGGCWFCYNDDGKMYFSTEWDSYFHMECMKKALQQGNPEAEVIADEFGIEYVSREYPEEEENHNE
jgi:hypothetical protein